MCDNFEDCIFISTLFICYWLQVPVLDAQGGKKKKKQKNLKHQEFGAEKFIVWLERRKCGACPQNPELCKGVHQSIFKGKVRDGCG